MNSRITFILCWIFIQQFPVFATNEAETIGHKPKDKPNIIFILTDDQRWDALGYAGNKIIKTPEMDRLARDGVYFSHAIVTTPICAASRASILSGVHERTHRYTFQTGPMKEEFYEQAYPALLKQSGYYTGFFGKFGVKYKSLNEQFDVYDDYDRNNQYKDKRGYFYKTLGQDTVHLTRYTGQQALDFIDQAPQDKPFCLSLSFSAPHAHDPAPDQFFWQDETNYLYQNLEMPTADLADETYFNILPKAVRDGFNRLRWTWRFDTSEKYQHSVKGYYRMIAGIDLEIAKIRAKLKEKGLDKNTIIILMGDNGYFLGERQLAGKWLMYDNSIRVPLFVFDPRVKKHQDHHEMALNIDVPATILDLAGVKVPEEYQGESLVPVINKTGAVDRDVVLIEHLWEFDPIPPSEGVRTKKWKYFRYVNDKSLEELYDLSTDPKEIKNLAMDQNYLQVLNDMRQKCDSLINRNDDKNLGTPTGLMVEFIREPLGVEIIDQKPEFSWISPKGSKLQTAYQILVSSSIEKANNNIGDVWNSGQIRSRQSTNIEYQGTPLEPYQKYYWKVRVWDQLNRLSEYSQVQRFEIGNKNKWVTTANKFQVEKLKPVKFKKISDDHYFADFGKDAFANLVIEYNSKTIDTLIVRLGEEAKDGKINRKPQGHIRYQEVKLSVRPGKHVYHLKLPPDTRNTGSAAVALPDSFPVLMPFRYCEIENAKTKLEVDDLTQWAYFNYWEEDNSSFNSSDTILNQVWDLCKYSIKATTFAGLYVDGDRERIPYEADAYLNQLSHYGVDREFAIARRTIEYFMEHPTWPTEWQLHMALMFYQDYMYTGNTELIEKYYEPLKHKTLMALENEDGLISTNSPKHNGKLMQQLGFADTTQRLRDIVDWPPAQKDTGWKLATAEGERDGFVFTPVNTVINSFYYQNLKIMAEFARLLNKPNEELDFRYRAERTKKAFNEKLYNEKLGYFVDGIGTDHGSIHANMLPLAFDIVPPSRVKSVAEHIKTRGMACSVYGAQYLLEGLYNAGEAQYALDLMTATHDRSWWNMIKVGSTITLEAWDMKYKPNADWNHAWGAAPANIVPRYLWGIMPEKPGFEIVRIKPMLGNLKFSTIETPTIKGNIKAEYQFISNRLQRYTIELPDIVFGEFLLEITSDKTLKLNGENVNPAFPSIRLGPGKNEIEVFVNSF